MEHFRLSAGGGVAKLWTAMRGHVETSLRPGFCIYIDTLCQGAIPVDSDEKGKIVVYATREEAEREIAEDTIERLTQFLEGTHEFGDAINPEEYVVEVSVHPDGSVGDEAGNFFPQGKSPCI